MGEAFLDYAKELFQDGKVEEAYAMAYFVYQNDAFCPNVNTLLAIYGVILRRDNRRRCDIDWYRLLELPSSASDETIAHRFATLKNLVAPALSSYGERSTTPTESAAVVADSLLNSAFEVLSNEKSKREFDYARRKAKEQALLPPPPPPPSESKEVSIRRNPNSENDEKNEERAILPPPPPPSELKEVPIGRKPNSENDEKKEERAILPPPPPPPSKLKRVPMKRKADSENDEKRKERRLLPPPPPTPSEVKEVPVKRKADSENDEKEKERRLLPPPPAKEEVQSRKIRVVYTRMSDLCDPISAGLSSHHRRRMQSRVVTKFENIIFFTRSSISVSPSSSLYRACLSLNESSCLRAETRSSHMFRPNRFKTLRPSHLNFFRAVHSQHRRQQPIKRFTGSSTKNPSNSPARKDQLQVQASYTRNTLSSIYAILKYSDWETAQQELRNLPVKRWDSYMVNQVLKTHPPMEKAWLFFNWAGSKLVGFKHDKFTYTTMVDIFGEAGRVESMLQVFDEMRQRGIETDAAAYTSVMHWVSKSGDVESAVKIWMEMKECGCRPTVVSYTAYMKILFDNGRVTEARNVYLEMLEVGITPNCYTYTVLMEHLVVSAESLQIKDENKVAGDLCGAETDKARNRLPIVDGELVAKSEERSDDSRVDHRCWQNDVTESKSLKVRSEAMTQGSTTDVGRSKEEFPPFGLHPAMDAGVDPDKAACNILIQKCCTMGETKTMVPILHYMNEHGLVLRYSVFLEASKALQVAGESDTLLRQVNPHCSTSNEEEQSVKSTTLPDDGGLVQILLSKKSFVAVDLLLTEMIEKNLLLDSQTVSCIIERNCDLCKQDGALLAFEYSRKMGVALGRTAYLCLTGSLMRSNMFDKVFEVVTEMIRSGHSLGIYLSSVLIYKLGKARRPTCAVKLFALLPDEEICTATYTALVSAYFSAGTAEKALKTFETMRKKGVLPSLGTYEILLTGLEKLGRGSEVEVYRKERKSLLVEGHRGTDVALGDKICDLLFAQNSLT
ncbi:Pentatricopeptide repeat-containing protein At2g01390 [Linum grandiflorum]